MDEFIWLDDMPVGFVSGGTLYFVHPDHLGTPQKMSDVSQNVAWDEMADPFMLSQQITANAPVTMNLRMPGQYYDAEDGLHYNFHRDYDPSIGRYVESDPIGLSGGINSYAYVSNGPLDRSDPSGLVEIAIAYSNEGSAAQFGPLTLYNHTYLIVTDTDANHTEYVFSAGPSARGDRTLSCFVPGECGTVAAVVDLKSRTQEADNVPHIVQPLISNDQPAAPYLDALKLWYRYCHRGGVRWRFQPLTRL
jgi:RHS repeat-associated protein